MKIVLDGYETYLAEKVLGFELKAGENTAETIKVEKNYSTTTVEINSNLIESVINAVEPVMQYGVAAAKAFIAMYAKGMSDLEQLVDRNKKFKKGGDNNSEK